ncbi:unnamed protein product [Protopolystoma xenopodis]|uniref:Uncharacterized protein n=1 Tax=Protopolystoma xenopodis TaxID=117903 RepID=A0A3S5BTV2_9PLAT|nr:unnamed protein product [Protopolystoma xenopodis]
MVSPLPPWVIRVSGSRATGCMVLRMAILTDDADYDAGEMFGNVPRQLFNFGNDHADNGARTRITLRNTEKWLICRDRTLHDNDLGLSPVGGEDET